MDFLLAMRRADSSYKGIDGKCEIFENWKPRFVILTKLKPHLHLCNLSFVCEIYAIICQDISEIK